jgi:hypothetical protein
MAGVTGYIYKTDDSLLLSVFLFGFCAINQLWVLIASYSQSNKLQECYMVQPRNVYSSQVEKGPPIGPGSFNAVKTIERLVLVVKV